MARILCIEDDVDLRSDLTAELREAGYLVTEAADGSSAVRMMAEAQPDLILCDISLPLGDGYGVLRAARAQERLAGTPFIFLTALADRTEVVHGKKSGADDYLTKPIDYDLLLATVDAHLRQIYRVSRKQRIVATGIEGALSRLGVGVFVLNSLREILFCNEQARSLVGDGLSITAGRLSVAGPSRDYSIG